MTCITNRPSKVECGPSPCHLCHSNEPLSIRSALPCTILLISQNLHTKNGDSLSSVGTFPTVGRSVPERQCKSTGGTIERRQKCFFLCGGGGRELPSRLLMWASS